MGSLVPRNDKKTLANACLQLVTAATYFNNLLFYTFAQTKEPNGHRQGPKQLRRGHTSWVLCYLSKHNSRAYSIKKPLPPSPRKCNPRLNHKGLVKVLKKERPASKRSSGNSSVVRLQSSVLHI